MRLSTRRKNGERGAALVEFAVVLPLLMLLIFGIIEFGLLFRERLTIASAASSAARTGATMGTRADADLAILQALEAGLYDQADPSVLIRVDIFLANTVTGAKTGKYNRYTYVSTNTGCKWDPCPDPAAGTVVYGTPSLWGDPVGRDTTLDSGGGGLDVLGVEIVYHHSAITNLIPLVERDITEIALVRLEPDVFSS
ncbi:MAG: pilus assembly protein [Actinomycetia bacterium]|nr:pilus assembly protein [Actinomycetes bacterium]